MKDLTDKETDRLDFVHNAIHSLLCTLAGREIEWDISTIAEISDLAEEHICDKLGLMSAREFAPYVEDDAKGPQSYLETRKAIAPRAERITALVRILQLLKHCPEDTLAVNPEALALWAQMIDSDLCAIIECLDDFIFPTDEG